MATWGPIQLRFKGSRQVEFDGEASPAPGGGSMPIKVVRVPIAFNTPGINADGAGGGGIDLYVPAAGDLIWWGASPIFLNTPWNAAGSQLNFTWADLASQFLTQGLVGGTNPQAADGHSFDPIASFSLVSNNPCLVTDATPLRVIIDDSSGGDPGATTGEGEIVLVVFAA